MRALPPLENLRIFQRREDPGSVLEMDVPLHSPCTKCVAFTHLKGEVDLVSAFLYGSPDSSSDALNFLGKHVAHKTQKLRKL